MSQFSNLSISVTKHWARALRLFPVKNVVNNGSGSGSHLLLSRNYAKFNPNREPLGNEDATGFKPKDSTSGQSEEIASNSGENVKKKESITERLMRMSMESAEDFVPRERKEPLDDEYRARFRDHPKDNRKQTDRDKFNERDKKFVKPQRQEHRNQDSTQEFSNFTETSQKYPQRSGSRNSVWPNNLSREQDESFASSADKENFLPVPGMKGYEKNSRKNIHVPPIPPQPQRPRPKIYPKPIELEGSYRDDIRPSSYFADAEEYADKDANPHALMRWNPAMNEIDPSTTGVPKSFRKIIRNTKIPRTPKTAQDLIVPVTEDEEQEITNEGGRFGRKRIFESASDSDLAILAEEEEQLTKNISTTGTGLDISPSPEDDPDTFGTLNIGEVPVSPASPQSTKAALDFAKTNSEELSIFAEEEADDYLFVPDERLSDRKLRIRIKQLLAEKKLTEALDIFLAALKDKSYIYDKYALSYIFALLIIECANVGHVEMTFRLFRDYIKRGFKVKPQMFTYLLNACANSPWNADENLKRIGRVRENMESHGFVPNHIHYHCMIKAYGRCGDLQSAFSVVDDMLGSGLTGKNKIRVTSETFSFLLQACISEPQNGFRHALVTWMKMVEMKIRPSLYSYNLFLRAVRECGVQIPKATIKLLRQQQQQQINFVEAETRSPFTSSTIVETLKGLEENHRAIAENSVVHDLIALSEENPAPAENSELLQIMRHCEDVQIALNKPEHRLALLGGVKAIISQMKKDRIVPDLKTLTELLQIVPHEDNSDIFTLLETHRIKPDIDFFNLLIKKCMSLHKIQEGRNVLETLPKYNLTPNVMTWGVLALGCSSWSKARLLLQEMDSAKMLPNIAIMGALLSAACDLFDPRYVLRVMEETLALEIQPSEQFLTRVQEFRAATQQGILNAETGKGEVPEGLKIALNDPEFQEYWQKFKMRYDNYMKTAEMIKGEEIKDPWAEDYKMRKENFKRHELP